MRGMCGLARDGPLSYATIEGQELSLKIESFGALEMRIDLTLRRALDEARLIIE